MGETWAFSDGGAPVAADVEALRIVRHILAEGGPPPGAAWTVDR